MQKLENLFNQPKLYQFLKLFMSRTINEINNEYNMSFIKFVFPEEDINFISNKLDLENDNIRMGINILKRNIREYNINRSEDINYILVDDTYRFFYLLNRIYEVYKEHKEKINPFNAQNVQEAKI